jgi:probable phosphoglycerate mutase
MTVRLIIARHGNTFRPEDKPVWVGARSDLPLVEKGVAQAEELAEALEKARIVPDAIIAGPLKRTQEAAHIVAGRVHTPFRTDARLCEIDYGAWEGKSSEEIIAAGDAKALEAWNKHSVFPQNRGWLPTEAKITINIAAILAEIRDGTSLIVTSNGIMRFFARASVNAADFPDRKVATGNICIMERDGGTGWRMLRWNQPPSILATGA